MPKKARRLPPVHPGEILREDLLKPLGISVNRLGRDLRVPVTRISEIVNGRRGVTADTALRLARREKRGGPRAGAILAHPQGRET
jgi:antitoxin HigA-1